MLMGVFCTVDSRFSAVTTISSSPGPDSFACSVDCAHAGWAAAIEKASAIDKFGILLVIPVTSSSPYI